LESKSRTVVILRDFCSFNSGKYKSMGSSRLNFPSSQSIKAAAEVNPLVIEKIRNDTKGRRSKKRGSSPGYSNSTENCIPIATQF